jgi:hypothetical protein
MGGGPALDIAITLHRIQRYIRIDLRAVEGGDWSCAAGAYLDVPGLRGGPWTYGRFARCLVRIARRAAHRSQQERTRGVDATGAGPGTG